jgi:hypothetical protein
MYDYDYATIMLTIAFLALWSLLFVGLGRWAGRGEGGRFVIGFLLSFFGGLVGLAIYLVSVTVTKRQRNAPRVPAPAGPDWKL